MKQHYSRTSIVRGISRSLVEALWTRPPGNFAPLDCLRAIAVISVVCTHYTAEYGRRLLPPVFNSRFASLPIFYWGWAGVDLFFILSGYLIGRQLWKERFLTGRVDIPRFFLRRGFRIWPLYFAMLPIVALTMGFHINRFDLVFLSNYWPGGYDRGWSLSTEEQFYIVVPILVLATVRLTNARWYVAILGALMAAVLVNRWHAAVGLLAAGMSEVKLNDALYYKFHLHCESLIAGLALALLTVRRPDFFKKYAAGNRTSWLGVSAFLGLSVLGLAFRAIDRHTFSFFALALIFVALTFWMLLDRGPVHRIASWCGFYPISRLSYGMYLNHVYIFQGLTTWTILTLRKEGMPEAVWFFSGLLVTTLTSIGLSAVTFMLIERPFLIWREKVASRPSS